MVELGIPELTSEQIENLCLNAENAAKEFLEKNVSSKNIERLDISVEVEGTRPVDVSVEVNLVLKPGVKGFDVEALVKDSVAEAHKATEEYLRNIK